MAGFQDLLPGHPEFDHKLNRHPRVHAEQRVDQTVSDSLVQPVCASLRGRQFLTSERPQGLVQPEAHAVQRALPGIGERTKLRTARLSMKPFQNPSQTKKIRSSYSFRPATPLESLARRLVQASPPP